VIVHLLEFRALPGHEAEVTGFLRHSTSGDHHPAGLLTRFVGRRLSRQQQEHIAVTCWRDESAFTRGTDPLGAPAYLAPKADLLAERRSSAFGVSAALGDRPDGARILRVYRARVATAAVEKWQRRAAEQLTALSTKERLVFARAGVGLAGADSSGEVSVVALSAWDDWDAVLAATGGHIDRLVQATELVDLERPEGVDHYELLESEPRPTVDDQVQRAPPAQPVSFG
jgi:hypothetical protein